jgi:putative addiction module killer protein
LKAKAAIDNRVARLRRGLLGDCSSIGEGVLELRIDFGPGYRVYIADDGESILLLCAGLKKTQRADVAAAKKHWKSYRKEAQ